MAGGLLSPGFYRFNFVSLVICITGLLLRYCQYIADDAQSNYDFNDDDDLEDDDSDDDDDLEDDDDDDDDDDSKDESHVPVLHEGGCCCCCLRLGQVCSKNQSQSEEDKSIIIRNKINLLPLS